jgi:hypothetical protein
LKPEITIASQQAELLESNRQFIGSSEWRRADSLTANHGDPNYVMTPELTLPERSLMVTGWVQPVLINQPGAIIDGFHRVRLS